MPFWPFPISPPKKEEYVLPTLKNEEGEEGKLPWHAQIISYLQFKEVFLSVVIIPDTEFEQYKDSPETSFVTQFARLNLFLGANRLDRDGRAWKELQEADPGFHKIRMIHELSDWARKEMGYAMEEPVTTFPEEWKDEDYFLNWLYVNTLLQLRCLDTETVEKAAHVIMHTNYVQKWNACGEEHKARIEREQEMAKRDADKMAKKVEKEKKKQEEKLLKKMRSQRKLDRERNYS